MAFQFTYSNDPENDTRDAVRLLIGDTDSDDPLLFDAEVEFYLAENGDNKYRAAMEACKAIAAKLTRRPDYMVGRTLVSYKQRAQDYLKLAETMKQKFLASSVAPYAGGISKADKETAEEDTDRVKPLFTRSDFVQPGLENPLAPVRTTID